MGNRIAKVLDIDGKLRENPDCPIAVVREATENELSAEGMVVDPVFTPHVTRNLYGRIMTLVEATSDQAKLKAVKDLFSKELMSWENDVYRSARQFAQGHDFIDPANIYTRNN